MKAGDLAARYRRFAEVECSEESPAYAALASGVARDPELLALLAGADDTQPNLLFAAARFRGAPWESYRAFRSFVLARAPEVLATMASHRTQTNEVGRCAVLLPVLAALPQPLALLEVGAAAGLALLLDHYSYRYTGEVTGAVGTGVVELPCVTRGAVPVPGTLPQVVWRLGLDREPVDLDDEHQIHWLEACVWPDAPDRLARLRAALEVARRVPRSVIRGDAVDDLGAAAREAPSGATLVVFHSATLAYLSPPRRSRFIERVKRLDAVWVANEAPGIVAPDPSPRPTLHFVVTRDSRPLALAHPHGRWIEWICPFV
ncbi:MAG: DUF2332 domain-containing protein [Candidatus Rokuibacteriota bacterium]